MVSEEIPVSQFKVGDIIYTASYEYRITNIQHTDINGEPSVYMTVDWTGNGQRPYRETNKTLHWFAHRIKTRITLDPPKKCDETPCRDSDCECVYGMVR